MLNSRFTSLRRPAGFRPRLLCLEDRLTPASFQGLGDPPVPYFFSYAEDVSADGSVVVGICTDLWGGEGFRWTAAGGMVGLGDFPGGIVAGHATGVSADGSVVVGFSFGPGGYEAYRWTAAGGMVSLGNSVPWATGVSDDGSVVVGQARNSQGHAEAYRWTAAGGIVLLGDLPGGNFESSASEVSADGLVVVGSSRSSSSGDSDEAFRWTAAGGMVGLGALPGGTFFSQAIAVSADGSVVVGDSSSSSGSEAFRWTAAGGMVGLGHLPGYPGGTARDVSADGSVVVGTSHGSSGNEAFRWTAAGGMRSVRDILVTDYGLESQIAGWRLGAANACSADGSVIVGDGINPAGEHEPWIARLVPTPPQVQLIQVNGGAAQRSMVRSVAVTFNQHVTLPADASSAFQLTRQSDNAPVNLAAAVDDSGLATVVTLTFTGGAVDSGSLLDGRYTLTAIASEISSPTGQLDGNFDGIPGDNYVLTSSGSTGVFRFFGDADGDGDVDTTDYGAFRTVFGSTSSIFDFDNDGDVDVTDLESFRMRFGMTV